MLNYPLFVRYYYSMDVFFFFINIAFFVVVIVIVFDVVNFQVYTLTVLFFGFHLLLLCSYENLISMEVNKT